MLGDERLDLRLHRQHPPRARSQHLRQRMLDLNPVWMRKPNNRISVHGVSFPLGNQRIIYRQDALPSHHPITKIQL